MTHPDQYMIDAALSEAAKSPCRSKRGVMLYNMITGALRGSGYNGPPAELPCPGREKCAGTCGQRSVHAEVRALRDAAVYARNHDMSDIDLIHVELAPDGGVVACKGPGCWQCSREILDVGFVRGVWLYERVPEENCPHFPETRRIWCLYCQGEACAHCKPTPERRCEHDVLDRHGDAKVVHARWVRYLADEFYRVTLTNCGMTL